MVRSEFSGSSPSTNAVNSTWAFVKKPPLPLHDARRMWPTRPRRGDPAGTRRVGTRILPDRLDDEELANWRAGRNTVYQLAAVTLDARHAVADA